MDETNFSQVEFLKKLYFLAQSSNSCSMRLDFSRLQPLWEEKEILIILAVIKANVNDDQSGRNYSGRHNENRNDSRVLAAIVIMVRKIIKDEED